jgi:hypothetical protein
MSKLLAALVVTGAMALVALPAPASADERRADSVKNTQVGDWEFSDHRRRYRRYYSGRRYIGPRYGYWGAPYYAPYYAYSPYYRPYGYGYGPGIGFGFSFGRAW